MLNTIDHHPRLQKFLLAGIMAGSMLGIINPVANASTQKIENPPVATQMVKSENFNFHELHGTPTPVGENKVLHRQSNSANEDYVLQAEFAKFRGDFDKAHPGYESYSAQMLRLMARDSKEQQSPVVVAAKDLIAGVKVSEKFPELGFTSYKQALEFDGKIKDMAESLPPVQKALFKSSYNGIGSSASTQELLGTLKGSVSGFSFGGESNRWDIIKKSERDWTYKVNEAHVKNGGENVIGALLNANGYSSTIATPQTDHPILNKITKSLTLENIAQRMDSITSKFNNDSPNTLVRSSQNKI